MNAFTIADFDAFFEACHGHKPFDWQHALAARVLEKGWPALLNLPTAAGKTAVMDIAIFALAVQADTPPSKRTAPRRIVFVVDRRVVVDGAYARAQNIQAKLTSGTEAILKRMKRALLQYGGECALHSAVLRGGIWRDESWARTSLQPAVLVSTVDQVGSRLLFSGYGLTPSVRPIHAGLLANDTLIVLDEAHLSRPFEDTLAAIARFRSWAEEPLPLPFSFVRMSATHSGQEDAFPVDQESVFADARLRQRLEAPKRLSLQAAKDKKEASFVTACVEEATAKAARGATIAVVVNRVGTARAIHKALDALTNAPKKPLDAEVILLTGRCRSVERDALLKAYDHRLLAGRSRLEVADQHPLIVVATQCVEAGADFDFDALISECCPLDCLRQRLGRLNRVGHLPEAHAVVIVRAEIAEGKSDDPVYGGAAHATWEWLCADAAAHGPVTDCSASALRLRLPEDLSALLAPSPDGPLIYPAYCDLWVQTNPIPQPSPDPAVFLHGPARGEPDVQLVWRADMHEAQPDDMWLEIASYCPPVSGETLSVRLSVARNWLTQNDVSRNEADIEGVPDDTDGADDDPRAPRRFMLWRGEEDSVVTDDVHRIRPGDTIVIPSAYGGCDRFGWVPADKNTVQDIARVAYEAAGRQPVLRLFPETPDVPQHLWLAAAGIPREDDGANNQVRDLLIENGLFKGKVSVRPYPSQRPHGWVASPQRQWFEQADDLGSHDAPGNDSDVELTEHGMQVSRLARLYAGNSGLSEPLAAALAFAGLAHDWGKADPRFQALLYGSRIKALRGKRLLAKSVALSDAARRAARLRSGYPDGARHELLSMRLFEQLSAMPPDDDLIRHLIVAHHGRGRAFAPTGIQDPGIEVTFVHDGKTLTASSATGLDAVDSGVTERFWRLTTRYGWWVLAYIEALLRLADHRASENPDMEAHS